MADGRRSQWFAMDAWFFDKPLGVALRERFGVTGLVLFVGFLSACKRSHIQGQIAYSNDLDALRLMGLPDLRLVDDSGAEWDLDMFWRALGQLKQTRKTARGRVKNVKATNWGQWQESFERQNEAARKRRSRPKNTPDDVPPLPGHYPDDVPPLPRTDSDSDNDSDSDKGTEPALPAPADPGQSILRAFWDSSDPKPAQPWPAMLGVIRKMLEAGWSEPDVAWALTDAPTVSTGALTFSLNRRGKPKETAAERTMRNLQLLRNGTHPTKELTK